MKEDWFTFDRDAQVITVQVNGKKELVIDKNNVDVSYYSGGPGGQNVNRSMNGVRIIFHIPAEYRSANAKTKEIIARSMAERSQAQNFNRAFEQLAYKIQRYFYIPPTRKKTRTPKRAKEKRLENKKLKSLKKQSRQKVDY